MKIPIFTDDPGWHGQHLKLALHDHGVEAIFVSLRQCQIDLADSTPQIKIPGMHVLPTAVFVRGVSGGTLQQVITRLNILHGLAMLGVRVYNDAKAIERTVDKGLTSFILSKHGVKTPATWVCESRANAEDVISSATKNDQPLVIKPLFGSQGLGVRELNANQPLPVPMAQFVDGVYYLQAFIKTQKPFHDYRLFVIQHKVVATMRRNGQSWLNNVAAGGGCEYVAPDQALVDIALRATEALNINYAGVDVIQSESGEYFVLEVNSIPAWRGLQRATGVNIAKLLIEDFLKF